MILIFYSLITYLCVQISTREGLISFSMGSWPLPLYHSQFWLEKREIQCSLKVITYINSIFKIITLLLLDSDIKSEYFQY